MEHDKRSESTVQRFLDGDEIVIFELGPKVRRKELARFPKDATESIGLSLLKWHVGRLDDDERTLYNQVVEAKPNLDPYLLIGITGYIRGGAKWATIVKFAGIKAGQMELA